MKKIAVLLIVVALAGCQQRKNEIIRLQAVQDSLTNVNLGKDSAIVGFLGDFNEIQANLDSIKRIEKLVTLATQQSSELKGGRKQQILEDIQLLNNLIQKNKALNEALQKKLNSANFKIGKLESLVTELETMVASLNTQIQEKDAEIILLNEDVKRLNLNIQDLSAKIDVATKENEIKTKTIENQTVELNKAFIAFGTARELMENNVLEKSGGVAGIGRTMKMKKDFNRDYFTEIDIRQFSYLPLMVKKATVVSVHPLTSYHITGVKKADTLFIDNKDEFWKAAKYMLVVID